MCKRLVTFFLVSLSFSVFSKELVVLATPKKTDSYYREHYDALISFQRNLALEILKNDDVSILVDEKSKKILLSAISSEKLVDFSAKDIWMRDPMPVRFAKNKYIRFAYAPSAQGGSKEEARFVQNALTPFLNTMEIKYKTSSLYLDGGNVITAGQSIVLTDRFLTDNNLTYSRAKKKLKELTGFSNVAIIATDDQEGLAHVDGMASFLSDDTLLLNRYEGSLREKILKELKSSLPGVKIVEVPFSPDLESPDERFSSACQVHLNILNTENAHYVPVFGSPLDKEVLSIIKANTKKKVVTIDASKVCKLGGSVRCLSWRK